MAKADTKETLRTRIIKVVGTSSSALIIYHAAEIIKVIKDEIVNAYNTLKEYAKLSKQQAAE